MINLIKNMKVSIHRYLIVCSLVFFLGSFGFAQEKQQVNWLTFEQLSDSLNVNPKKVIISFHTDWCAYCRKMHGEIYTKPEVAAVINEHYYAVKFDAESMDTVRFDGQSFVNRKATKRRKGIHDIALLLAGRDGRFTAPTTLILDENFRVISRHFEYMDSKKLLSLL